MFLRASAGSTRNDVIYSSSTVYDNDFSDTYAGATIGYNFSNRPWNVNADVALQWERNKINSSSVSEIYPVVNVSAAFLPSHHLTRVFPLGG